MKARARGTVDVEIGMMHAMPPQTLWFTAAYNAMGITLAVAGLLPPVLTAAAQALPDLVVMASASRLLRRRR